MNSFHKNFYWFIPFFFVLCGILSCRLTTDNGVSPTHYWYFKVLARLFIFTVVLLFFVEKMQIGRVKLSSLELTLFLFCLLTALSVIYSIDKYQSGIAILELISNVIAAFYIGTKIKKYNFNFVNSVTWLGVPIFVFLIFYLIIDPDMAFRNMNSSSELDLNFVGLGGQIIHVHSLAMMAVILVHLTIWNCQLNLFRVLLVSLFSLSCVLTLSRTGAIGLVVVFANWVFLRNIKSVKHLIIFAFSLTGIFYMIIQYGDQIANLFVRGSDISVLLSGSHRLDIFYSIWTTTFQISPILGFGYGNLSLSGAEIFVEAIDVSRSNAHASFFQVLGGTGIVGLILFIILQIQLFRRLYRNKYQIRGRNGLIFILVFFQFGQTSLVGDATPIQFIFYAMIGYLCYRPKNIGKLESS